MTDARYETEQIPARFRAPCEFCPHPVDTRKEGSCQFTFGWVMNRGGGGGHGIMLPTRQNKWAHRDCIDRQARLGRYGGDQKALL